MNMADNREEMNKVLDKIIAERRTIRIFKDSIPPKENIELIIKAGILAPYAGATGRTLRDTRRFVVFQRNTDAMNAVNALMLRHIKNGAMKFKALSKIIPYLRKNGQGFVKILENMALNGIPAFKTAPYFIVVAEHKGFPPAEKQSLAHVMENMWLKATALGLGFQLLSATSQMSKNKKFMDLIGIPVGEYGIDGCVIGYPDQIPLERSDIPVNDLTRWLN
jgi:nitroreductase